MSFSQFELDRRLLEGVAKLGFTEPTPIQAAAIPEILAGRDVLGTAQTGTGKTAAFMLPLMNRLLDRPGDSPRVLVLAPTRELAEQIRRATNDFGRFTRLRTTAVYGGVGKRPQAERLRKGIDVLIACPGRLLDIYGDGDLRLDRVEAVVLDEADRMFDMGFLPDVRRILNELPVQRQNLFFSATMPSDVRRLADGVLYDPANIAIGTPAPAASVAQAIYPVSEALKGSLLAVLLRKLGRTRVLVFARTKHRVQALAGVLRHEGHRATAIEGNMTQGSRQAAMDGFRKGRYDVLVATDVAARGIDVTGIETVINYDMPDTFESYTHRVGRTGRAAATGMAVSLASPADTPVLREIESQTGQTLEQRVLQDFDYDGFNPRLLVAPPRRPGGRGGLGSRRGSGLGSRR